MRVTRLTIKNVGVVADACIEINKPLIVFYGDVRQGKTTILNAVRWCLGGAFPSDIIRHGEDRAYVRIDIENGSIVREWYRAADGSTKAKDVTLIKDGAIVKRPVAFLQAMLNPFQLNQNHLVDMSELERRRFFAELFNTSDAETDARIAKWAAEASELRAKIKGYGHIDLTPPPVDDGMESLTAQLAEIEADYAAQCRQVEDRNAAANAHNAHVTRAQAEAESIHREIKALEAKLDALRKRAEAAAIWLQANQPQAIEPTPPRPDVSDLQVRMAEARANEVRLEQYQANLERARLLRADEARVSELEQAQRQAKASKVKRLADLSESCGIPGLAFDAAGEAVFEGTSAAMLSTSQIMRLSELLSARYPDGFGLDLLDRGESLGSSIFSLIDRATQEQKTILATVVGERPASVPDNVGVFVVENGTVR